MPDSTSIPPPADLNQRKRIVIAAAAVFVVILAFAFVSGGRKKETKKDEEQDLAFGFVQDGASFQFDAGGIPDDWLNAPEGMGVAENSNTSPAPAGRLSSVVTGDDPAANPLPSSGAAAVAAMTPASASQPSATADARPSSSTAPAAPMQNTSATPTPPVAAAPSATTASREPMPVKTFSRTPVKTVAEQPVSPSTPATTAHTTSTVADVAAPKKAPSPDANSQTTASTNGHLPNSVASAKATRPSHAPEFVKTATKKPGVIGQTRSLVSEEQFHRHPVATSPRGLPSSPATPKTNAPAPSAPAPAPAPAPAQVRQEEARTYAQQTTERLREEKRLTPAQRVRLPRSSEAPSTRIWREDDQPVTANERRPFGLVIEDTAPAFTPEDIPIRTDIPPGASPLEKTGADKPLWKRTE